MLFDQREWVNDMVTGAITGMAGGVLAAMIVPASPVGDATAMGGIFGFITGMLHLPIRWLLNRRPPSNGEDGPNGEDGHEE